MLLYSISFSSSTYLGWGFFLKSLSSGLATWKSLLLVLRRVLRDRSFSRSGFVKSSASAALTPYAYEEILCMSVRVNGLGMLGGNCGLGDNGELAGRGLNGLLKGFGRVLIVEFGRGAWQFAWLLGDWPPQRLAPTWLPLSKL